MQGQMATGKNATVRMRSSVHLLIIREPLQKKQKLEVLIAGGSICQKGRKISYAIILSLLRRYIMGVFYLTDIFKSRRNVKYDGQIELRIQTKK